MTAPGLPGSMGAQGQAALRTGGCSSGGRAGRAARAGGSGQRGAGRGRGGESSVPSGGRWREGARSSSGDAGRPQPEHGRHLPTGPALRPRTRKLRGHVWVPRSLPGVPASPAQPRDSSGAPCPGTALCHPSPRSSVCLAGPVVWDRRDRRDCRESCSLSQRQAQRSETGSVPVKGSLPFQRLLPAL